MAPLRRAAKFDPFLSLDCAPTPSTLAQSKERKGSNFAIWQPWRQVHQDRRDLGRRQEEPDPHDAPHRGAVPPAPGLHDPGCQVGCYLAWAIFPRCQLQNLELKSNFSPNPDDRIILATHQIEIISSQGASPGGSSPPAAG